MCIVCGNSGFKKTIFGGYNFKGIDYHLVRCLKCGFMFLDPLPEKEVLNEIYQSNDYFADYYIQGSDRLGYLEGQNSLRHNGIINLLKKYKTSGKLLDIGCAGGNFLRQAKAAGYDVTGVEPNPAMAEEAKRNTQAEIKCGNFSPGLFEKNNFDIIRLGDVLEHVSDPADSIRTISGILKDNGLLVLEQPLTYNNSLFNLFLASNMLFKKEKFSKNPPAHLWEFNPRSIRRLLEQNSFSVSFCHVYENGAKPLFVYKEKSLKNNISRWLKNISAFISNFPLFKKLELGDRMVAICRKKTSGKPRILFLHPNLNVGGAEQNRLSVLKHINRQKFDITLCCLTQKGKIGDEIETLGFSVDCLHVSDRSFNLVTTFLLYTYIKKNKFQLVHTCLSNTNLHGRIASRLAGVPVIISEEQSEYERYNPLLGFIFKPLNRFLSKFTDKVITCSDKTKQVIAQQEKIPQDKFLVLHNVIDAGKFESVRGKDELLKEFGLSDKDVIIGYVATLTKRKGHTYLLEAFKQLSQSNQKLKLILVGDGALKIKLENWVKDNNLEKRVIFTGQRRDIPDILSIFRMFVSPAMFEAFGIVLAEAMNMGLPCVAFRVGGIPEVVEDGLTGVLVEPGDISGLAKAIETLLNNPELAKRYGKNGKKKVQEKFTAEKYALSLENLYDNLLKNKAVLN